MSQNEKDDEKKEQNEQIQVELKEEWTKEDEKRYQMKGARRIAHIPKQTEKANVISLPFHKDDVDKAGEEEIPMDNKQESSKPSDNDSVKSNRQISLFKQERLLKNLDINKK